MEEQVVTLEVARLLKEKSFVNGSQAFYNANNGVFYVQTSVYINGLDEEFIEAPTQTLAQKWLRLKHRFFIVVTPQDTDEGFMFSYVVLNISDGVLLSRGGEVFDMSYEEVLEEGLKQALKLI